tara:strand:- start:735 stop:878 length:144 start_codon:yes stop_codon:yes gene_type:complete
MPLTEVMVTSLSRTSGSQYSSIPATLAWIHFRRLAAAKASDVIEPAH